MISNVAAIDITQTSANVTWTLSEPSTGQVEYGTTTSYGQTSAKETSFQYTSHTQALSGLVPTTLYHFRVRSLNQAGIESVSDDFTFTTGEPGTSQSPCTYPPDVSYSKVAEAALAKPALLVATTDPAFGTQILRISDNVQKAYAKVQAWNSDQTLIGIGSDSRTILDGQTYQVLRTLPYSASEVKWSHLDPNKMFGQNGNRFMSIDATTGEATVLHTFSGYEHVYIGPWEGNISMDDRYVVLVTVADAPGADVIVYDIANDSIITQKSTTAMGYAADVDIDWISISQSGNYVVVLARNYPNPVRSFDRNLNLVADLDAGEHADLGYDAWGNEVFVQVGVSGNPAKMTRLDNGQSTDILQTGLGQHGHMSCRNVNRPGWCYLSMVSTKEVLAIKLDGSQTVERFVQTRNSASALAVASPDGTRVMYDSDWNGTATLDTYVGCVPK